MSELEPKGDFAQNEDAPQVEDKSEQPKFTPEAQQPSMVDPRAIAQIAQKDQSRLAEIRGALKTEPASDRGWIVTRKPSDEWKPGKASRFYSDSPIDQTLRWLRSFSKSSRELKRSNERLLEKLKKDRAKNFISRFDYRKAQGVEGRISGKGAILATGFHECSGLVFQTGDKVAIVHISPNALKDPSEGGEIVKDDDVWGHVKSALKGLISEEETFKDTENNTDLSESEIAKLQEIADSGELCSTLLAGEDKLVPDKVADMFGRAGKAMHLPFMKTNIYYVGDSTSDDVGYSDNPTNGNSIYATPESLYYVGSNGQVLTNENFPPPMYEYRDK